MIKDVSTASSVDKSGSKRRKLGLGHIWIEYDDGAGAWLLATRPTFYDADKLGGWRLVEERSSDAESSEEEEDDDDVPDDLEDGDDEMSDGDDDDE